MQIKINVPDGYQLTSIFGVGSDKTGDREEGHVAWSPDAMTNAALVKVLEYGAQRIVNDKTGGADKTFADKQKIADERVVWLTSEDFVARQARASSTDPLARYRRAVLRDHMSAATKVEYKKLKTQDERDEFLDDRFAGLDEATTAEIETAAQARKSIDDAAAAERAKLDVKVSI